MICPGLKAGAIEVDNDFIHVRMEKHKKDVA